MAARKLVWILLAGVIGAGGTCFAGETETEAEDFVPSQSIGSVYYHWSGESDFEDTAGATLQYQEAGISVPIPIIERDSFRVWTSLRFRYSDLDLAAGLPIDGELDLYRVNVPVNALIQTSDAWSLFLRAEPGLHSDFKEIDSDDFLISALAVATYQWRPRTQLSFGAFYSQDLGEERLLPAIGVIWKPNAHWTFNLTAPRLTISYAPHRELLFSAFAYPGGGSWNVTDPVTGEGTDLNYQSIRAGGSVERALTGPLWGYLSGGYQFAQEIEVGNLGEMDVEGAPFGSAGVRLRF
ncbi:MAG: DUF6268 family outer membrane beta-barrel protein [Verrucomicrobiota bacterium]